MPQWWQWSHDKAWWHSAGHLHWGHVKQKAVDARRWQLGVHQVVFWCGTAMQGSGARRRQHDKWQQRRGADAAASSAQPAVWRDGGPEASAKAAVAAETLAVKQEGGAQASASAAVAAPVVPAAQSAPVADTEVDTESDLS